MSRIAVMVHGGAGRGSREHLEHKLPGLRGAVDAAWNAVVGGKPALFAVVDALRVMEESPYFNAGFGGYPNRNGIVLLDVGLMNGTRDFVSLIHVRKMKFPSLVALDMFQPGRTLLTTWTHELMTNVESAEPFIKARYGLVATHEDLVAPYVKERILQEGLAEVGETNRHGTVGCVVRDKNGLVAAGTSTGGINFKLNGRIGDSPIIGSGVFADQEIGALSTTGHGESLLKALFSGFILSEMRSRLKEDPDAFSKDPGVLKDIVTRELGELSRKGDGGGGIILLPSKGRPVFGFNTDMISLGYRLGNEHGEVEEEDICIALKEGEFVR